MTVLVEKTLIPARPVGKELLRSTNIPFLDRNNPHAYSTRFQEDFQPFDLKKVETIRQRVPGQAHHKDFRYTNKYLTETTVSYQRHPLPQIAHIPWATCQTNFKMQTDSRLVAFLTTQSQNFQPHSLQLPPRSIQPTPAAMWIQQAEKLPESTTQANFIPPSASPFVKATAKHLEVGFPAVKGDERHHSFVSEYNNTFQGTWSRAAQSVKKHTSSVLMGDPVKIVERQTTHATSFSQPGVCRQPVAKEHVKLILEHFSQHSWSSTTREDFCYRKLGDPVVRIKGYQNFSSLPKGDTDTKRNQERISVTTNRISFPDLNHTQRPASLPEPDMITKSHVQFSPPSMSGLYYATTAKEHFIKKDGVRARQAIHLPSIMLSGPEQGLGLSTTKSDYLPLKTDRPTLCRSPNRSNLKFPLAEQHFRTTSSEDYTIKPLNLQRTGCSHVSRLASCDRESQLLLTKQS